MPTKKTRNPSFGKRMKHLAERSDPDTGRLVPTHLRDWERADILTMYRSGHSMAEVAELMQRSVPSVRRVILDERQRAEGELGDEYLANHRRAAAVAAERGNAQPSMDMLDRLGMVPAASRDRLRLEAALASAQGQRDSTAHLRASSAPVINIGIGLPGLRETVTVEGPPRLAASDSSAMNDIPGAVLKTGHAVGKRGED